MLAWGILFKSDCSVLSYRPSPDDFKRVLGAAHVRLLSSRPGGLTSPTVLTDSLDVCLVAISCSDGRYLRGGNDVSIRKCVLVMAAWALLMGGVLFEFDSIAWFDEPSPHNFERVLGAAHVGLLSSRGLGFHITYILDGVVGHLLA